MENRKITTYITTLLVSASALFSVSCVKETLYNTQHPTLGAVKVTTDWSASSPEATLPKAHTLRISRAASPLDEQTVNNATNVFHSLLSPAAYELLVYNTPSGITINGRTAAVHTLNSNRIEPLPEYLFSAIQTLDVQRDDTLHTNVKMQQRIRQLTLILKLSANANEQIQSISSTLTGIARSIDISTGVIPATENASVAPTFTFSTGENNLPILMSTMRLLGIVSSETQILSITITMDNGTTQTITTDLSSVLKNFGSSVAPLTLNATLTLPPDVGISGSITDWVTIDNGNVGVN